MGYTVRVMTPRELDLALAWAAAEGWNASVQPRTDTDKHGCDSLRWIQSALRAPASMLDYRVLGAERR